MVPSPQTTRDWVNVAKDVVLIVVGIFIIIHETWDTEPPRVPLLIIAGAALGLPILDYFQQLGRQNGGKE